MRIGSFRPRMVVAVVLVLGLIVGAWNFNLTGLAQEGQVNMAPATPNPLGPAVPPELSENAGDWPAAMGNLQATRDSADSPIDSSNVAQLEVAWSFPIEAFGPFGAMTAPPIVVGDTVYVQDMQSNVFALDRESGEVRWEKAYEIATEGPNGVAIGYGLIFGTLGNTAEVFALDAETGEETWRIKLSFNNGVGIDMVPTVYDNTVYVSTVPGNSANFYQGGQRGVLYALDAASGDVLWEFDTTTDNLWGNPRINSGGGLWYPLSVDDDGNLYFGVGNAAPWPGTDDYPNGSSRPGDNDYANSMVSLDRETGAVRWYHNAKPHDLFDLDFQLTPVLATVPVDGTDTKLAIGAGKTGTVVAANADTGEVLWEASVGTHENDEVQEIPEGQSIQVFPGPLGGVETSMAYADGLVFVPVVNLPINYTSTGLQIETFDFGQAAGELVALDAATGEVRWQVEMPTMNVGAATVANDVVFTSGLDGLFRAYSTETGDELWTYQAAAGFNAPPAIAGDMVIVPAGGFLLPPSGTVEVDATPEGAAGIEPEATPETPGNPNQLIAFRLPGGEDGDAATEEPAEATAEPAETAAAEPAETETAGGNGGDQVTVESVDVAFEPEALTIPADTDVAVALPNSGAALHNFRIDELEIDVDIQPGGNEETTINASAGEYAYYCDIPGHRQAGMEGTLTVE